MKTCIIVIGRWLLLLSSMIHWDCSCTVFVLYWNIHLFTRSRPIICWYWEQFEKFSIKAFLQRDHFFQYWSMVVNLNWLFDVVFIIDQIIWGLSSLGTKISASRLIILDQGTLLLTSYGVLTCVSCYIRMYLLSYLVFHHGTYVVVYYFVYFDHQYGSRAIVIVVTVYKNLDFS